MSEFIEFFIGRGAVCCSLYDPTLNFCEVAFADVLRNVQFGDYFTLEQKMCERSWHIVVGSRVPLRSPALSTEQHLNYEAIMDGDRFGIVLSDNATWPMDLADCPARYFGRYFWNVWVDPTNIKGFPPNCPVLEAFPWSGCLPQHTMGIYNANRRAIDWFDHHIDHDAFCARLRYEKDLLQLSLEWRKALPNVLRDCIVLLPELLVIVCAFVPRHW